MDKLDFNNVFNHSSHGCVWQPFMQKSPPRQEDREHNLA